MITATTTDCSVFSAYYKEDMLYNIFLPKLIKVWSECITMTCFRYRNNFNILQGHRKDIWDIINTSHDVNDIDNYNIVL